MSNTVALNIRLQNGEVYTKNNINISLAQAIKAQTNKYRTSATRTTTVGTITYPSHGFSAGDSVVLSGTAPFDGTYTIDSVNQDSFNITVANSGATSDTPVVLRTVLKVNEYRGGNMVPVDYTITQPLTGTGGLSTLIPVGSFVFGTVIFNGPSLPGASLIPVLPVAEGTPTLFFTNKIVNFSQVVYDAQTFTDMDRALTVVTVTAANHGYKVGDWITVDASNNALDGTYQVATVTSDSVFTYNTTTSGTISNATGTGYLQRTETILFEEGAQNNAYLINELYSTINTTSQDIVMFAPIGSEQAISGPGAITLTQWKTNITTTGADAFTLANAGVIGHVKKIALAVDGGDATITPTSLSGGTTITLNDAGDYVELQWNGTAWVVIENSGATIA